MRHATRSIPVLFALLVLLNAQTPQWRGTWSATSGSLTLGGGWTATQGDDANVAFGSWTLLNAAGKQVASGTWSARKAEKRWEGSWEARDAKGATLTGTWTARSPIISPARLSDMLEFALSNVVNGTWQAGRRKGGWSIRAYPIE